jgi:hypothetical protein
MATTFQRAIEQADVDAIGATLAPDIVFRSPVVHRPYDGCDAVLGVLAAIVKVFEDFNYTESVESDDRMVLFFSGRVGDRRVQGIDALRFDADGKVKELTVMIRPLSGLQAVAEAVGGELAAGPG